MTYCPWQLMVSLYVATLAKWLANPTTVSTAAWIRCVVFLEMADDSRWQLFLAFMILKLKLFGPEVDKNFNCEVHSRFKSWCFIDTMKIWSLDPFLPTTFITQKTFRKSKWKRSLAAYRENASWTVERSSTASAANTLALDWELNQA